MSKEIQRAYGVLRVKDGFDAWADMLFKFTLVTQFASMATVLFTGDVRSICFIVACVMAFALADILGIWLNPWGRLGTVVLLLTLSVVLLCGSVHANRCVIFSLAAAIAMSVGYFVCRIGSVLCDKLLNIKGFSEVELESWGLA